MTNIERLRQYLMKASFGSAVDKFSAMECLAEIERELAVDKALRAELAKPEQKPFFPFRECEDSQAAQPAQEPRPPNCGTGHCSCIEGYDPAYLAMVRGIGGKA